MSRRRLTTEEVSIKIDNLSGGRFKYIPTDLFPYENYYSPVVVYDNERRKNKLMAINTLYSYYVNKEK